MGWISSWLQGTGMTRFSRIATKTFTICYAWLGFTIVICIRMAIHESDRLGSGMLITIMIRLLKLQSFDLI